MKPVQKSVQRLNQLLIPALMMVGTGAIAAFGLTTSGLLVSLNGVLLVGLVYIVMLTRKMANPEPLMDLNLTDEVS